MLVKRHVTTHSEIAVLAGTGWCIIYISLAAHYPTAGSACFLHTLQVTLGHHFLPHTLNFIFTNTPKYMINNLIRPLDYNSWHISYFIKLIHTLQQLTYFTLYQTNTHITTVDIFHTLSNQYEVHTLQQLTYFTLYQTNTHITTVDIFHTLSNQYTHYNTYN